VEGARCYLRLSTPRAGTVQGSWVCVVVIRPGEGGVPSARRGEHLPTRTLVWRVSRLRLLVAPQVGRRDERRLGVPGNVADPADRLMAQTFV
jgi:hypothetical protein